MLYRDDKASMLIPHQADVGWCDLTRVFSDDVPSAAGIGAALMAQQALGLSPQAAATLVNSAGASSIPVSHLAAAATARPRGATLPSAINATRIPIPPGVVTDSALVGGDSNRGLLLLQNNNAAGGANLLWSVDGPIDLTNTWAFVNLAPGQGISFDETLLANALYVAWDAAGTVTGGVVLVASKPPPVAAFPTNGTPPH